MVHFSPDSEMALVVVHCFRIRDMSAWIIDFKTEKKLDEEQRRAEEGVESQKELPFEIYDRY